MITSKEIIRRVDEAIKQFGTYSFYDKGPDEVMEYESMVDEINKLSPNDAYRVLANVKLHNKECEYFVEWITEGFLDEKFYTEEKDLYTQLFPSENEKKDPVVISKAPIPIGITKHEIDTNQSINEDNSSSSGGSMAQIEKQYAIEIEGMKKNIDPTVIMWIEETVPSMNIQDFNLFMAYIHNLKHNIV